MKYYYYTIEFRDGEREYSDGAVIGCHEGDNIKELIEKHILATMWCEDTIKDSDDDGIYYSPDYSIAVKLRGCRQISKAHFMVLKQYLLHDIIKPEEEKVDFT